MNLYSIHFNSGKLPAICDRRGHHGLLSPRPPILLTYPRIEILIMAYPLMSIILILLYYFILISFLSKLISTWTYDQPNHDSPLISNKSVPTIPSITRRRKSWRTSGLRYHAQTAHAIAHHLGPFSISKCCSGGSRSHHHLIGRIKIYQPQSSTFIWKHDTKCQN